MSFILDALKKSENERQRQIGPSLADIPVRRSRSDRPWWAVAVAALLVVNLGVLVAVLARNRNSDPQPQPSTSAGASQVRPAPQGVPTQAAPPPASTTPAYSSPAVRPLADEAGIEPEALPGESTMDPALAGAANVPEGPPVVSSITPPAVAPLPNQATFAARGRTNVDSDEMLPTHSSLISSGTSLPDMRLDIHVYSANPADRFIFVNMRKYVEGQTTSEGPLLERITTQGAIFNQHGTRFLLPRQ